MKWTMRLLDDKAKEMRRLGFSRKLIFEYLISCYEGAFYTWGGHEPERSDCSGTLRGTLSVMTGMRLEETADSFYKKYFTKSVDYEGKISAIFFIDSTGRAVHVAAYAGSSLFINCSRVEPGQTASFRTEVELRKMYPDFRLEARSLDEDTLSWR